MSRLGLPNIAKYEHELLHYATERLAGIDGLRLIGTAREKVGVISFVLRDRKTGRKSAVCSTSRGLPSGPVITARSPR